MKLFKFQDASLACVVASSLLLSSCALKYKESYLVKGIPAAAPAISSMQAEFPGYQISELKIPVSDGEHLYSMRFMRPDAKATVLYFGGNMYRVGTFGRPTLNAYKDVPVNLVLVDHRGYGASSGTPTVATLMSDAVEVYDGLRSDPAFKAKPMIVHGQSLGSFLAGHVAKERKLDGLVLESSVTTTEAWVDYMKMQQPFWKRMWVRKISIDGALAGGGNLPVVKSLDEPVLILVGEKDSSTPIVFSKELFAAVSPQVTNKKLVIVPDAGHNNSTLSRDFREAMKSFVQSLQ